MQIVERLQCTWVVLPQCRAQRVGVLVAGPDQILMRPGQHFDSLGIGGVTSNTAVVVSIGADQIGQQFGVGGIGLGSGDVVAVAVTGGGHRVDRIHLVAGPDESSDPQAAVSFDADHDLVGIVGVAGQEMMELAYAGKSLG